MRESLRSLLRVGLMVLVVAALAMSGLALAQTGDDDPAEAPATEEDRPGPCRDHHGFGHGLIAATAEVTGLEPADIVDQLRDGTTLAEIAEANGSSTDAIVDAALANLSEKLDEAVTEERITQEEADEKLAEAEERLTERAASDEPFRFRGHRRGGHRFGPSPHVLLDTLDLTPEELREAVESGQTLAEIAEAQGVSTDDLVAAMTAGIEERLADAVADEKITQEEADEKLAEAQERAQDAIENGFQRDGRRGFGPRGPGRFGPPAGEEASTA